MKHAAQYNRPAICAGMTLVEVVLAIAVAGFLLAAAASFVVSISNIWSDREARYFFEDHVDGVTEFLQASLDRAGVYIALGSRTTGNQRNREGEGAGNRDAVTAQQVEVGKDEDQKTDSGSGQADNTPGTTSGLVRTTEAPVSWARLPGASEYEAPLLHFSLMEMPPLLIPPEELPTMGGIDIYLHFDKENGLTLLWHSILKEEVRDENDLRGTEISRLVTDLKYIYWDADFERWEEEDEPLEGEGQGQYLLPRYLKLFFEYEEVTTERVLTIPVPSQHAFLF